MSKPNFINLKIYEFLLNGYPKNGYTHDLTTTSGNFITTSIKSSDDGDCGYIGSRDGRTENKKKIDKGEYIRSCDMIDGIIDLESENEKKAPDINIKDIDFDLMGITSKDLITFSFHYPTKMSDRNLTDLRETQEGSYLDKVGSMAFLYNLERVLEILNNVKEILKVDWLNAINGDDELMKSYETENLMKNYSLIKILRSDETTKYIIIGDIHGSFATFIRILLRLRKMNIMNEKCEFRSEYNLIFLGDLVDRGIYGYEIVMLICLLKRLNPGNIHINNGNHEERNTNGGGPAYIPILPQIQEQFGPANGKICWTKINDMFDCNHSALLIENPKLKNRYVYLAHGGLPVNVKTKKLVNTFTNDSFKHSKSLLIDNNLICEKDYRDRLSNNSIRWSDFYPVDKTQKKLTRGAYITVYGKELLLEAYCTGIDLVIRGHQDLYDNTKLVILNWGIENLISINQYSPNNTACKDYTHLITQTTDGTIILDGNEDKNILPVITLSTNTDYGKDLNRDSFAILEFQDKSVDYRDYYGDRCTDEPHANYTSKYLKYKQKYLNLKKILQKN